MRTHASAATSALDVSGSSVTSASSCGARRDRPAIVVVAAAHVANRLRHRVPTSTRRRATAGSCGSSGNRSSACIRCRAGGRLSDPTAARRSASDAATARTRRAATPARGRGRRARAMPRATRARMASAARSSAAARTSTRSDPQKRPQSDSRRAAVSSSRNAAAAALRASMRGGIRIDPSRRVLHEPEAERAQIRQRGGLRDGLVIPPLAIDVEHRGHIDAASRELRRRQDLRVHAEQPRTRTAATASIRIIRS